MHGEIDDLVVNTSAHAKIQKEDGTLVGSKITTLEQSYIINTARNKWKHIKTEKAALFKRVEEKANPSSSQT